MLVVSSVFWLLLGVLSLSYSLLSDRWAWSEYITVWPPLLWCVPLGGLAVLLFRIKPGKSGSDGGSRRRHRWMRRLPPGFLAAVCGLFLFFLLCAEWRSLLRSGKGGGGGGKIRVVTWNLNSVDLDKAMAALEPLQPDICCFQEAPERWDISVLSGAWDGYGTVQNGETLIVSRFPLHELESHRIGPWSPPQLAVLDLPSSRTLLVTNVRLMLPSLILNPLTRRNWERLNVEHDARVEQYPALMQLIGETADARGADALLLAGDFNTRGGMASLQPIRNRLQDAWPAAGHGWGRTMTADFPVARIDHVYTSDGLVARNAEVHYDPASDHRMLVVDLELTAKRPEMGGSD